MVRPSAGFFLLRTPLLPFAWLEGLGTSLDVSRGKISKLLGREEVQASLFSTAPWLEEQLEHWRQAPDQGRGPAIESLLVAYIYRMAAQPAPFGLFAGVTVGAVAEKTDLVLGPSSGYRTRVKVSSGLVRSFAEVVEGDRQFREQLIYRPNPSLWYGARELRYLVVDAGAHLFSPIPQYRWTSVDCIPLLGAALSYARSGVALKALAEAIRPLADQRSLLEVEDFVHRLIDSQLLVSQLEPALTGDRGDAELRDELRKHPGLSRFADLLTGSESLLSQQSPGHLSPASVGARYRQVIAQLGELPKVMPRVRAFEMSLVKPGSDPTLSSKVVAEIHRGAKALWKLTVPQKDRLQLFRNQFLQGHAHRELPLLEVMDPERGGWGFQPASEIEWILASDSSFFGEEEPAAAARRDAFLLPLLERAWRAGEREIEIQSDDLPDFRGCDLPEAFSVLATVVRPERDRNGVSVRLDSLVGSGSATLLARHCADEPRLAEWVSRLMTLEDQIHPEAIIAEIVHSPSPHVDGLMRRPVLRGFEIPILARSGAQPECQLALDDLLVTVVNDRVVLRSKRLNRQVIPRLTVPHPRYWSTAVYQFLCEVSFQDGPPTVVWRWGGLSQCQFLPRVRVGSAILSPAQWSLDFSDAKIHAAHSRGERFSAVQKLRSEHDLPRWLMLLEREERLPIDLDNPLSVELLARKGKGRPRVVLQELLSPGAELLTKGPEGPFLHQVVIPFVEPKARAIQSLPARGPARERQAFLPGDEWLYVKIIAGPTAIDLVLRSVIEPVVEEVFSEGLAESWHFVRYAVPEWHLRLRFRGEPKLLQEQVWPRLKSALVPYVEEESVRRVQIDTYLPEVERHGGGPATALAEELFHVDSEFALRALCRYPGDLGVKSRWPLCVYAMDALLNDFGLSTDQKLVFVKWALCEVDREMGVPDWLKRKASGVYRKMGRALVEQIAKPSTVIHPLWDLTDGLRLLTWRSEQIAPLARAYRELECRDELSVSFHWILRDLLLMQIKRLMRAAHNEMEFTSLTFLERIYTSSLSRAAQ